jgi:cold shock CspA family protein
VTVPARRTGHGASAHRGVVEAFDAAVGLGTIRAMDGTIYPFHCIEIADGSRDIAVGAEVVFDLLAKFGRWEAAGIRK